MTLRKAFSDKLGNKENQDKREGALNVLKTRISRLEGLEERQLLDASPISATLAA